MCRFQALRIERLPRFIMRHTFFLPWHISKHDMIDNVRATILQPSQHIQNSVVEATVVTHQERINTMVNQACQHRQKALAYITGSVSVAKEAAYHFVTSQSLFQSIGCAFPKAQTLTILLLLKILVKCFCASAAFFFGIKYNISANCNSG